MCHCIGHSDFFKNNRMFEDTRPESVTIRFRNARKRIQGYIEDPSIGVESVEKILDAAHAIKFQTDRHPRKKLTHKELKAHYLEKIKNDDEGEWTGFDINRIPLEPEYDVLGFVLEHSRDSEDWEKDLINIVREESEYFIPQIKTKIMNEGWASFWHYRLMHKLDLPQKYHIPFLKSHNQVIRPHIGGVNPYHLGFNMFLKIEERHGIDRCFMAREICHDESFIREYITEQDCRDLNLFSYSKKKDYYTIDDISDEEGWEEIKAGLIKTTGMNGMPSIYVDGVDDGNILVLQHEHDGRDLDLNYADEVIQHITTLWGDVVKLMTIIEDEPWEI
jgi:stage V sporulation protein R